MNFIHEVDPGNEDSVNVIIEIPKHSRNKYEIDKDTGLIALDRALHTSQDFPVDYGFVPQTMWYDDDPLDCIVLTTYPLSPGIIVRGRIIGIMEMIDCGDSDDKIIVVSKNDPRWNDVVNIDDVNPHTLKEIQHFFETYKNLQSGDVIVKAFHDSEKAKESFHTARKLYKEMMEKN